MARYNGLAEWYDRETHGRHAVVHGAARKVLRTLLGPGPGRALDLCCGGGTSIPLLRADGWTVVGVDESEDQLRVARDRAPGVDLVQSDAASLPFPDASFDAVAATFVHTDVDDFGAAVREAARVLKARGRFVHVGHHPGFVGHFAESLDNGARLLHTGYFERERRTEGPGIRPEGIRSRVGVTHLPLSDFLNGFADAALILDRVEESHEDPPVLLAVRAFGAN